MIFCSGIRGLDYAPDDEDIFEEEDYDESAEDRAMDDYYERKYNND